MTKAQAPSNQQAVLAGLLSNSIRPPRTTLTEVLSRPSRRVLCSAPTRQIARMERGRCGECLHFFKFLKFM